MLAYLRSRNPDFPIYDIHAPEFSELGNVIATLDTDEIVAVGNTIKQPNEGSLYIPSEPKLEALSVADEIRDRFFGTLPVQIGYCHGHSNFLNAAEWHASNEVNVAVTPLVLFLGSRRKLDNGRLEARDMKAFYVPAGTALEIYSSTLHFCPCEVAAEGFGCVVALPQGTNTPLDAPTADPLLFRRNKWIVAHDQNEALLARGVLAGIGGINYEIKY